MYEKHAEELKAVQTTRPRLLKQRRDELVILCIRHQSVCAEAMLTLRPEHYSLPDEKPHQTIIRHLWRLIEKEGYEPGAVPYAALYDAIATEMTGLKPSELEQAWVGETINDPTVAGWEDEEPGLLYRAYHADMATFDSKYAFGTLQLFLEERAVVDAVASLVASTGARVPIDHTGKLDEILAKARRVEAIGSNPFSLPMPENWQPVPLVRFPTGCGWVDDKLGGQVAGDVNGLMGMYAGGKTTGMTQIAVGSAFYFLKEAEALGRKPRVALFVSYEEREGAIRPRILSCASRVSKTRLEEMTSLDQLTRAGKLEDYEITMYREEGQQDFGSLPGEYERLMLATQRINQTLRIVDMRDGGRGRGWVDELAGFIDRLQHEEDVEIGVVCLDYVNAMCRRFIAARGKDPDRLLRHYAHETPLMVEERIAQRFGCPVWLAQQFSGEANKKAPTAKMMIADASEAKNFGENLVFCVAFGATDPQTKCIQSTFVKTRRRGMMGVTTLLRLEGDLSRLVPVDHLYIIQNDKIVDLRIAKQVLGDVVVQPKSPYLIQGAGIANWEHE